MGNWHERLNIAFRRWGGTQTELETASGVSVASISKYLGGKVANPRGDIIDKLADALDVDRLWLKEGVVGDDDFDDERPVPALLRMARILEVDVRSTAGGGAINYDEEVAGEWGFPASFVASELRARPGEIRIHQVEGDSMVSDPPRHDDIYPGEKLVLRTTDNAPSPPGIFTLFDGLGLVTKRLEYIPGSEPPTIRIMSNNPRYETYERTAEEVQIVGRVIGKWMRY